MSGWSYPSQQQPQPQQQQSSQGQIAPQQYNAAQVASLLELPCLWITTYLSTSPGYGEP